MVWFWLHATLKDSEIKLKDKETIIMRKINVMGNGLIVLGILTIAATLLAFLWPLWLGIVALFAASRLISFFNGKKEVVAEQIMQIIAQLRSKPRTTNG